jgi:2-octaprenyl-6-methoxyphenol hydroxylase
VSAGAYDIVIAGGGMVGVSLALCLERQLPEGTRLLLVESFPLPAQDPAFQDNYSPSFDARSTALSYSSCLIYRELGLWEQLSAQACPINDIHVSERGRFGSTLMRADDYGWPALGYVLENTWLGNLLLQSLHDKNIETLSPATVARVQAGSPMTLELSDGRGVEAELLVVADGANSGLRSALGAEAEETNYQQHALIANIGHALPHQGCAFERFTPTGPLALLPLRSDSSYSNSETHRSALVWSLSEAEAQELKQCDEGEFLARLQEQFGYRLGRLQRLGERHSYPLSLIAAREQVRSGAVIMGNAAHSLHPVAGQGFNLALRDVACLSAVLRGAAAAGQPLGDLGVLETYLQQQAGDQERTMSFSDRLPGLFMHRDPALALLRDVGLFALDLSPALKREFVRHTSGVAASSEYRDVQP